MEYLKFEKRYSPHTILSYEHDLAQFCAYLDVQYGVLDPLAADALMIRSWVVSLLEQSFSPRSVNRKLSTLKSFYHFCIRQDAIQSNPLSKVISPKNSSSLPVFVEKDKMQQLVDHLNFGDGFEGIRNKVMIMLLYATGMRRSELLGLKTGDLELLKGQVKVVGKRNKERIIPIGSYLCEQLEIYCKEREKIAQHSDSLSGISNSDEKFMVKDPVRILKQNNQDSLFVTSSGKLLNIRKVYSIVHDYLSLVSSQSRLSPHVLRHTFATHMLNEGADLNAIKEILGHTSLAATQVYTHNTIQKLKQIHKQAHPRA